MIALKLLKRIVGPSGPVTFTYDYDDIDQLTCESDGTTNIAYEYDDNGNRTKKTVGSTVYAYTNDEGDKLATIKIGSTTVKSFTYDEQVRIEAWRKFYNESRPHSGIGYLEPRKRREEFNILKGAELVEVS